MSGSIYSQLLFGRGVNSVLLEASSERFWDHSRSLGFFLDDDGRYSPIEDWMSSTDPSNRYVTERSPTVGMQETCRVIIHEHCVPVIDINVRDRGQIRCLLEELVRKSDLGSEVLNPMDYTVDESWRIEEAGIIGIASLDLPPVSVGLRVRILRVASRVFLVSLGTYR